MFLKGLPAVYEVFLTIQTGIDSLEVFQDGDHRLQLLGQGDARPETKRRQLRLRQVVRRLRRDREHRLSSQDTGGGECRLVPRRVDEADELGRAEAWDE